jgi:vacuolar-type H+-ATPase subunit H
MTEIDQEPQEFGVGSNSEATPREEDQQALLLKLAQRSVLQAKSLAQEITDRAGQESEAEGAKHQELYTEKAKAEAQQITESAQLRSETLINEARAESEQILGKARSESEESLGKAQTGGQEVLGSAQQEALAIINAARARADSTESSARLKAEFIIRETTQKVADGIRNALMENSKNLLLLQALDEIGKEAPEAPASDQVDPAATVETDLLENAVSNETDESSSPPDLVGTPISAQSSSRPSGRRAKSIGGTQEEDPTV